VRQESEFNPGAVSRANAYGLMQMLQTLLKERFQIAMHTEQREMQHYELVIGKNGPKLKSAEPGSSRHTRQGHGTLNCAACTISNLAAYLSNFLTRPVRDETGIQGVYNMSLEFEPYDDAPSDDGLGRLPSLFTALQDQLGLKLESKKIPVQILVVDSVSRPGDN